MAETTSTLERSSSNGFSTKEPPDQDEEMTSEYLYTHHVLTAELETFGSSFLNYYKKMFNNPQFSDVKIEFNSGETLFAHRTILASWSTKFMNLLQSNTKTSEGKVHLKLEHDVQVTKLMIRLMYEGVVLVVDEQVLPLLTLASIYDMEPIKTVCAEILFEQQKTNISYLLDVSQKFHVKKLEALCANHFAEHFSDLLKDTPEQLMKLEVSTWVELLKKDKVDVGAEQTLYEAVMNYITLKFPKPGKERDEALALLMPHIRFALLSSEYLVSKVEGNELLRHIPVMHKMLYDAFRWKALPPNLRSKDELASKIKLRNVSRLTWSTQHKNSLIAVTEDNMTFSGNNSAVYQSIRTSTGFRSPGRHYFEVTVDQKGTWLVFGICDDRFDCSTTAWVQSYKNGNTWLYHHDYGAFWKDGVAQPKTTAISPITVGSAVGVMVDFEEGKVAFTLNGIKQGEMTGVTPERELFPFLTVYQSSKITINSPPRFPYPG